eukprot:COSAG02_NODE_59289_length_274_cov_1.760000_1_plen_36_part_01
MSSYEILHLLDPSAWDVEDDVVLNGCLRSNRLKVKA